MHVVWLKSEYTVQDFGYRSYFSCNLKQLINFSCWVIYTWEKEQHWLLCCLCQQYSFLFQLLGERHVKASMQVEHCHRYRVACSTYLRYRQLFLCSRQPRCHNLVHINQALQKNQWLCRYRRFLAIEGLKGLDSSTTTKDDDAMATKQWNTFSNRSYRSILAFDN